jgi:hypothetical protein
MGAPVVPDLSAKTYASPDEGTNARLGVDVCHDVSGIMAGTTRLELATSAVTGQCFDVIA